MKANSERRDYFSACWSLRFCYCVLEVCYDFLCSSWIFKRKYQFTFSVYMAGVLRGPLRYDWHDNCRAQTLNEAALSPSIIILALKDQGAWRQKRPIIPQARLFWPKTGIDPIPLCTLLDSYMSYIFSLGGRARGLLLFLIDSHACLLWSKCQILG